MAEEKGKFVLDVVENNFSHREIVNPITKEGNWDSILLTKYVGNDYENIFKDLQKIRSDFNYSKNMEEDDDWRDGGIGASTYKERFHSNYIEESEQASIQRELTRFQQILEKGSMEWSVTGSSLSVPRSLIGHPRQFRRRGMKEVPAISIYVGINALADISAQSLNDYMLKVFKIIVALSYKYRLRIVVGKASESDDIASVVAFTIKDFEDSFNTSRLYFPLTNVGTYRRLLFTLLELQISRIPAASSFGWGYGRTLESNSETREAVEIAMPEENFQHVLNYYSIKDLTDEEIYDKFFLQKEEN
ncbi:hypothetical protein FK481_0040 [Listeria phage LP-010]|uniref:DUF7192 domain-containing protein n=1 Tax=Listeria phage LP-010 TaxID=2590046 RepID=A0A514U6H4_9CAUD|nr:hypothetical protein FK481_0040 [Listeria phage LP-010]